MPTYSGAWRNRGQLAYAIRPPYRQPTSPTAHDGQDEVAPSAMERITAPKRQGPGSPDLIVRDGEFSSPRGGGWRGDRTPHNRARGYVGAGYGSSDQEHAEAYAAHGEDLGAADEVLQFPPRMWQTDRSAVGWNQPRINALGHGSMAALGRGLNGLEMNNDPAAQHYAINQVGVGRVSRKTPGRRIWTRYLTPLRLRVAAQAVKSQPAEISPATSWAPTLTPGRFGKVGKPVARRAPRDWTESVTIDDSSAGAEYTEPAWGL